MVMKLKLYLKPLPEPLMDQLPPNVPVCAPVSVTVPSPWAAIEVGRVAAVLKLLRVNV